MSSPIPDSQAATHRFGLTKALTRACLGAVTRMRGSYARARAALLCAVVCAFALAFTSFAGQAEGNGTPAVRSARTVAPSGAKRAPPASQRIDHHVVPAPATNGSAKAAAAGHAVANAPPATGAPARAHGKPKAPKPTKKQTRAG